MAVTSLRFLAALVVALGLCACSDTRVTLAARGVVPINLNDKGESNSVRVRIFPLRADARFRAATFESLWQLTSARDVLGPDWVRADPNDEPPVATIHPGGKDDPPARIEVTLPAGTRYLGIVALYPRSDAKDLRTLVLAVDDAEKSTLLFTGYAVSVPGTAAATSAPGAPAETPAKGGPR